MTNPLLALESATVVLPDGRTLFSALDYAFDQRPTALVGRNGVGKSVLARVLAGQLPLTTGRCLRSGSVHYLPQQIDQAAHASVAALAGVAAPLAALAQIEAGSADPVHFDTLAERWNLRRELHSELALAGLAHLRAETPAQTLSGGEAMRVALVGAQLSAADFLILDEPSNHLDRPNRLALLAQLQRWPRGLLVISHDRQLLQGMSHTLELSPSGLRSYGGGYAFYAQCKAEERAAAVAQLEQRKTERRREELALREQRERQERRQANGNREAREANQAKILLGLRKDRSEDSAGKLRLQQAQRREIVSERVREAAQQVEKAASVTLHAQGAATPAQRRVAQLDAVDLPFVAPALRRIDLLLGGRQRIAVSGPNGCGKSTLLKVLAGLLPPLRGTRQAWLRPAYLDQHLAGLDPQQSTLQQLTAANHSAGEDVLRTYLAQLDLDAQRILLPSGLLSGGERLKAALACALYADPPAQWLLLDEPGNHLDLASLQALEAMLQQYPGALAVVSHDEAFLDRLGLTHRLQATAQGWRMEAYDAVSLP
ncbi:ATPase subunit of ABC transporter with duplicated ATPase domains [Tahibacter aquaticus]|uniref:ATPase subunit of ABC transporter with duplicated ATPase domains n=1 Tax=Tahibacter aquaticus TaxID=520092 RepID=A0A4R6YT69_9GAMM|nr:ATP-binding cassette domain-containing protein [Tahibacter aquaticus]TDR41521.1 ATPase subunit of ABC transporter with duplicated ATPase domains [Tahibacter aquaticus]